MLWTLSQALRIHCKQIAKTPVLMWLTSWSCRSAKVTFQSSFSYQNSGLAAHHSKAHTREASIGRKESLLYFGGRQQWERRTHVQKPTPHSGQPRLPTDLLKMIKLSFKREFQERIGRGRGLHAETVESAPTDILKLIIQWSGQCRLDCFRYS